MLVKGLSNARHGQFPFRNDAIKIADKEMPFSCAIRSSFSRRLVTQTSTLHPCFSCLRFRGPTSSSLPFIHTFSRFFIISKIN